MKVDCPAGAKPLPDGRCVCEAQGKVLKSFWDSARGYNRMECADADFLPYTDVYREWYLATTTITAECSFGTIEQEKVTESARAHSFKLRGAENLSILAVNALAVNGLGVNTVS